MAKATCCVGPVQAFSVGEVTLVPATNEQFSHFPSFLLLDGVINTKPFNKINESKCLKQRQETLAKWYISDIF